MHAELRRLAMPLILLKSILIILKASVNGSNLLRVDLAKHK